MRCQQAVPFTWRAFRWGFCGYLACRCNETAFDLKSYEFEHRSGLIFERPIRIEGVFAKTKQ